MIQKDQSAITTMSFQNIVTNTFVQIFFFAALMVIAAQFTIPAKPVPFTLQSLVVVLSGAFLGAKKGAMSQILYLLLGLTGLPVFAIAPELGLGIARLFGPTGGYLLAFPLGALLTGMIIEKKSSYFSVVMAMIAGELLIIISGALYLDAFFIKNFEHTLKIGVAIFSVWLLLKVLAASTLYFAVKKYSDESEY